MHKLGNSLQMSNTCISLILAHADIRHVSTIVLSAGFILHCFQITHTESLAIPDVLESIFTHPVDTL